MYATLIALLLLSALTLIAPVRAFRRTTWPCTRCRTRNSVREGMIDGTRTCTECHRAWHAVQQPLHPELAKLLFSGRYML